jgi:elongation factor G
MGDVIGDLNSRRGKVLGMDSRGQERGHQGPGRCPRFRQYAPDLRSMTGGRGIYKVEFSHYEEVPAQ